MTETMTLESGGVLVDADTITALQAERDEARAEVDRLTELVADRNALLDRKDAALLDANRQAEAYRRRVREALMENFGDGTLLNDILLSLDLEPIRREFQVERELTIRVYDTVTVSAQSEEEAEDLAYDRDADCFPISEWHVSDVSVDSVTSVEAVR